VACHPRDADALTGARVPPRLCTAETSPGRRFFQEWLCRFEDRWPARTPIDELYTDGAWRWGFHVIPTPGHTEGSVMLWHEPTRTLFSGDTIIAGLAPLRAFEVLNLAFPAFSLDVDACHAATREFIRELPPLDFMASGHGPAVGGDVRAKLIKLAAAPRRRARRARGPGTRPADDAARG
jgi:glyoxylase-like metal-dependent hydrolase (beta-lactamase superfamily II)